MFQHIKLHHQRLPTDPDDAAAVTLADLSAPAGDYPYERTVEHYRARMAEAGIVFDENGWNEQGFLLRRLTARYLILETAWMQIVRQLSDTRLQPKDKGYIVRSASKLQEDMDKCLGLILKVRKAQGEDTAPFLTEKEQAVCDNPRADDALSMSTFRLSIPQLVAAEMMGEAIADEEFNQSLAQGPDADPA